MSLTSDFFNGMEKRKKKKYDDDIAPVRTTTTLSGDDIAPVRTKTTAEKLLAPTVINTPVVAPEKEWYDKIVKKPELFNDGYQAGDVAKTILGTTADFSLGVLTGVGNFAEGIGDTINYGIADIFERANNKDFANALREETKKSLVQKLLGETTETVDKWSVLGDTSDSVAQGLGMITTLGAGGMSLGGAGVGLAGQTALTTGGTLFSGVGSGMSEAYEGGATDEEARTYGLISGTADALSELIFGGLGKGINAVGFGKGLSSADDMLAKKVSDLFSNQIAKNLAQYGIKSGAEGFEEVLSGVAQGIGKKITYMSDKELGEILNDESLLEQFVVGAVTSGFAQAGDFYKATKTGTDFVTGLTENEQKVIDKEVENRIAESETDGTKLTKKQKEKIKEDVLKDLDKGYISIDTIESALGGETYNNYATVTKQEDAIINEYNELGNKPNLSEFEKRRFAELERQVEEIKNNSQKDTIKSKLGDEVFNLAKGSRLAESYNEKARRGQTFEADLSKYDAKQQDVIKKAVESGVLNNTNRTHEFVDMVAKISADKGVPFDFVNNEKLKNSSFAVEGRIVNGYRDGNTIGVNIDSKNSLNTVVGHEITHILKGTEFYDALEKVAIEFSKTKGDFATRMQTLRELYTGVYKGKDFEDMLREELTADIVGEYLFNDTDFINKLSTEHRNIFQKIYDEIKYLCKVATAGSKEARELENLKKTFDKIYRESGNTKGETKYSLAVVEKVEPTSNKWHRTLTTEEAKARFPKLWDVTADESEVRNPTQISSTVKTYRRVYDYLQSEGFDGTILDASSGLGYGTRAGIEEYGFNVEDIEPFPDKSYNPKYRDYSTLNKKYDVVISNAVLNVLPQDQRDALVIKMGELLNDGGRMFVSTRGRDVDSLGTNEKNTKISPMEWFVDSTGSYQKGFTKPELVAYLKDALGDGYTVKPTNLVSGTAAIVTKDGGVNYSLSETDNKYLSAVENGDTETAQKMVAEAAKTAGYDSPILYHGTKGFGFTKIKTSGVETGVEWSPFFATNNIYTALTYSGVPNKTEIGKKKRPKKSFGTLRDEASMLLSNSENATTGFVDAEYRDSYIEQYGDIMDEGIIRMIKAGVEGAFAVNGSEFKFVPYEDGFTAEDYDSKFGNYGLYAKTEGFLVIDGENREWNKLHSEYGSTTRLIAKNAHDDGYKGVIIRNVYDTGWDWNDNVEEDAETVSDVYIFFEPQSQVKSADAVTYDDNGNVIPLSQRFNENNNDIRYSLTEQETQETNEKLNQVGLNYDVKSETISYSLSSLEDTFNYKTDENGLLVDEDDYLKARNEYVDALAKSIAVEKGKPTREEYKKADRYLDSLFLVHDMIAADKDRLDYEAAVNRSAWVGNVEYGGSIDFSTLCAKRRLFTGTFDAIQNELPDTVLTDKDFLNIRNLLLEHGEESPCSMCYVEGSRAKHGVYVNKWLKEYLNTNPEWKPQIADFTSTTRLEQTRIQHPEAYAEYVKAMNKLSQRKPKEASVRTDYKGEILDAFSKDSSVETKNKNGGIRFNSFSDFEIIHALDCMQVLTDMSRVGLNGQAYTKVKEFAESFGNTGLKINLSLVAKDVDANGKLIMDETNGMNYAEAMDIRNRYSENVGTVIVVFNDEQLKSALADNTIDFVLPFHRSQWRKSQYALMGLPEVTRDYTNIQNDRYMNPKTNRPKKAPNGNIMPNEYWDFTLSGRENAQKYLDYINENAYIPKFDFLLDKVDGKWVLPNGAVGDGYFKLLIDFKMYNNDGVGSPQKPVLPEFNMPYIQQMLNDYVGGHQAFPVAHDVVDKFVEGKKNGKYSLSAEGEHPTRDYRYGNLYISGDDVRYQPTEDIAPMDIAKNATTTFDDIAPMTEAEAKAMRNDIPIDDGEIAPPVKSSKRNGDIEQPIAKVLTKEPEVKKKSKLWSKIKTNFIDKASPFETLALKTGNREVDAKFNSIRYADSKAQTLIGEGAEGVKSLNDIQAEVENDGLTQSLYEYLYHKHNVDRMTLEDRYDDVPNRSVFGNSMTAELSQKIVDKYESENPKLIEYANDIYTYNKYLRNLLVEGGVISQETADLWEEMYPHYVPIRRVGDEGLNINVALDTGRTGINAPVKRATGGNRDILPLFDTMAQRTLQTYKAIAKNRFGIELKNTLGTTIENTETSLDEVIDSIDTQDSLLQEGKDGRNPTFTVFENGEKVTFEITDEMYDAMKPTSEGLSNDIEFKIPEKLRNKIDKTGKTVPEIIKPLNALSSLQRGVLTEYNPTFMLTNAIKDAQDVFINSQHSVKTYKNFPKAIKELTTKGKWYTEYMQNGGADNTYFDKQTNSFNKEKSGLSKAIGFPLEKISEANNFIERIPRLAEYIASRESGRSIDVSMLDAARVTTNFSAGGDVTKFLNRNGATFLNASVQGAAQQVRNIREAKVNGLKGWVQLASKVALAGLPVLFLNGLLWDDDEEYEDLSDYVKQNYYVVAKMQDGKFVRIPKGRAMAVIQEAFTQIQNALTGDDEVDLQNFLELAVSNLAPNNPLDNNIIAPIKQVIDNKTWYGEDLVPTRLQDVPDAEQYDENTDAISKWLGEKLNYSPYKINYLLDQYSGGLGDVVLPMLTPKAESGDNSMIGFLGAPMRDKFSTDSVFNNQNTADFYNVSDELKVNANSSDATDEDVLKSKYFNSISTEISDLYKEKREIQNSNLSDAVKYKQVRDIQEQINQITENALNTYENVKINGSYANIGDRHYRLNDDGEWQKITDEQLEKQNEVIGILGITPSQYWGNKAEYDMKAFYPEKYKVLQEQGISVEDYKENYEKSAFLYTDDYSWAANNPGKYTLSKVITDDVMEYRQYTTDLYNIKADKDSSGKSISGSRKKKVVAYINSLDIEYGAKYVLWKSQYPADKTYNKAIFEYINGRSDITRDEKITILEELGAKVDSNGNVRW